MTKYDYKITCSNGHEIEMKDCAERVDISKLANGNWQCINCDNLGQRMLINMSHVVSVEEHIRD